MFIPTLPPKLLSTWAKRVVGIFINFIPLLKMLAANPDTSPAIPPPIDIIQSFLLKLFFSKIFKIEFTLF